jgi:hypothetical protein
MHLRAPDLLTFASPWHFEQHVRPDAPLERRVDIRRQIRCEDLSGSGSAGAPCERPVRRSFLGCSALC